MDKLLPQVEQLRDQIVRLAGAYPRYLYLGHEADRKLCAELNEMRTATRALTTLHNQVLEGMVVMVSPEVPPHFIYVAIARL